MKTEKTQTHASIEPWRESLRLNNLSEHTVTAYISDMESFFRWLKEHVESFTSLDVAARTFLLEEKARLAPASFARKVASMRNWSQFTGTGLLVGFKVAKPTQKSPRALESLVGVEKMIAYAHEMGKHDVAGIIAFQGYGGLRISETLSLTPESFDLELMELTVVGKGEKVRIIPLTGKIWFEVEQLLIDVEPGQRVITRSYSGSREWVKRCFAHIDQPELASHALRATAATRMHLSGAPLRVAQEVLGHGDPRTTMRYTQAPMKEMREAMETMT